ncbi:transposase, IS982 family [Bathymodiolus platifrons methanotrophic gill symbiont]|uniref:IS982 family transposase n=4 Tax=Bathymodiolus platifrons methanotrophic gill symbiont TaxID=113268 RepID=UPI001B74A832|nr:IS982 family transposase [Bathymodiolus platifrons methanotrophic gill symbiont]GFO74862.1 transposase, IS982 family [Bathymodiolus platifrons methanotrophic gill symbiont]GFO75116.1 transposase, IS982 family [Bathymodiolus platifrons methanotrophic gill symbiont]GFO75177.1 transposase, IS982 family [Bathymodiolus platifrons methanotrophic gill symbiont]GFO76349.1 transposase, IS982 family [Bathymodiolus platifrons methanotrophic gill symbiont]GFO77722.1 transposase, IS982 family [Bathymodi
MSLTQLFCDADDFCKVFIPEWEKTQIESSEKKRRRKRCISTSEIISLIIYYHQSGYGTFKWFYLRYLPRNLSGAFPKAPSYNRFIELLPEVIVPLTAFMQTRCGKGEGIAFVDSTPLRVCKNLRIPRHKTFKEVAQRGKSSTGWFYGFKLHIIVDDRGEILSFSITKGNVDDRKPVPYLAKKVIGKLFGDRGYISKKLTELLATDDVELITTLRKNMKPRVMAAFDAILLRKRSIIETINDQLKNIFQLEHSRHRSLTNYMVNAVACLVAYSYQEKKPALNLRREDLLPLL